MIGLFKDETRRRTLEGRAACVEHLAAVNRTDRKRRALLAACCVLGCVAPLARAQQPTSAGAAQPRVSLEGDERVLWVMQADHEAGRVFRRGPVTPFDLGTPVTGRVIDLFSAGEDALILLWDKSIWRYGASVQLLERVLPNRARPLHVVAHRGRLTALVQSDDAARMERLEAGAPPRTAGDEKPATSQPFKPGAASLSVAVLEHELGWRGWVPCPAEVQGAPAANLGPRLLSAGEHLFLICHSSDSAAQVLTFVLDESTLRWTALDALTVPGLTGFWGATLSRVPSLVCATQDAEGRPQLALYRRLGDPRAPTARWQPTALNLSALPAEAAPLRYEGAVGFNQGLALLMLDTESQWRLRFAGIDAPPTEETVALATVLGRPTRESTLHLAIQMATLAVLLGLIVCFVVFRRNSMMQPLPLPPGVVPAFVFQRCAAGLIDLGIFAIPLSIGLNVPWRDGFSALAAWGMFGGPNLDVPYRELYWWGLSAGGFVGYTFVLELLTRRTLGKAVVGIQVISESGQAPRVWQIALRSLLRPIELAPQFWMLAVLVLVSRNRQRMGDIFARTVVVRQAEAARGSDEKPPDAGNAD